MEQHERRPHQVLPPHETDPIGPLRDRQRGRPRRRSWTGPLLASLGVMLLGVFTLSTCGESESGEVIQERIAVIENPDVAAGGDAVPAEIGAPATIASNAAAELAGSAPAPPMPLREGPMAAAPVPPTPAAPPGATVTAPPVAPAPVPAEAPPAPAPTVVAKAAPVPAPAPPATGFGAAPPTGAFSVQLVSVRDPSATRKYWETALGQYPDLFAGLTPSVQTVDLGAQGVYHRLKVSPFESRASAARTCDAVKARGGSCLVVAN